MLRTLADPVLSVLFPQECRVCSRVVSSSSDGPACSDCWTKTRIFTGNEMLCDRCGAFFSDAAAPGPVHCHKCDDHKYDKAYAIGVYEKALSAAVLALKNDPQVPQRLCNLIIASLTRAILKVDLVVPVPLSKMRRIERGFNQAELIGAIIARSLSIPQDGASLARTANTPPHRVGMDQRARELTVQKAFKVVRPNFIKGKSVLLVDDVLTSGSTVSACAAVLKKNGAVSVEVFTLARAVMR